MHLLWSIDPDDVQVTVVDTLLVLVREACTTSGSLMGLMSLRVFTQQDLCVSVLAVISLWVNRTGQFN